MSTGSRLSAYPVALPAVPNQRIGLLSTFPPKLCGLATFAAALETALVEAGHSVDVVRVDDGDHAVGVVRTVAATLVNGVPASVRAAASVLSRGDVAIVQHEYGIYGGPDGDEVLDLLRALTVPAIVVLHTVPLAPTARQRSVLTAIGRMADRLVVMTDSASARLLGSYPVDPAKVVTIPHGAAQPSVDPVDDCATHATRPQLQGRVGSGRYVQLGGGATHVAAGHGPHTALTVPEVASREGVHNCPGQAVVQMSVQSA